MKTEAISHKILVLLVLPLILYVGLLSVMPLMEPDEGRYALIPQHMNVTADYVTPHLKGVVYLEKPPLGYWGTALAFKGFGENETASRLFPALCAWGCLLLVYRMGRYFHDGKTGLYSAAVLTTCLLPFVLGRINILDMPLALFLSLAVWSGFRAFADPGKFLRYRLYLLYVGCALAFLTKGLIGIVFPFAIVGLWLLWSRRWRDFFRLFSPVGMFLFSAVAGPWLWSVQKANPDFFYFFFVQEHLLRYTTTMHERTEPIYYYILIMLAGTLPWWPYLPKAIHGIHSGVKLLAARAIFTRREVSFCLIWIGVIFLFFSLSSSKLASYMAPLFPPLALLLGHTFRVYEERSLGQSFIWQKTHMLYHLPIIAQAVLFMGLPVVPFFIPEYQKMAPLPWFWYALPMAVPVLILFLPPWLKQRVKSGWFLSLYLLGAVYLALILYPAAYYLTPGKSSQDVVQAVKKILPQGAELYQYKISLYGVDFYTGMRTPIVDDLGELKFGADKLSPGEKRRYFPTAAQFVEDVRNGKSRYCITEGLGHVEGLRKQVPAMKILWDNGKFYMLYLTGP